jgi:hypothetical protein
MRESREFNGRKLNFKSRNLQTPESYAILCCAFKLCKNLNSNSFVNFLTFASYKLNFNFQSIILWYYFSLVIAFNNFFGIIKTYKMKFRNIFHT